MNDLHEYRKQLIEELYEKYNDKKYVRPDPLEYVLLCSPSQRETAGLISASFAYGRVWSILKILDVIFKQMDFKPKDYLLNSSRQEIEKAFANIKYRFSSGEEIIRFFIGIKKVLLEYGSLRDCFCSYVDKNDKNYVGAALKFAAKIKNAGQIEKTALLPLENSSSPCKRLMLFLRWMIRKDNVDPGVWETLDKSKLIIPLDTHMLSVGKLLQLTPYTAASLKTAMSITDTLAEFCHEDPVKYDFALTRSGIRGDNFIPRFHNMWEQPKRVVNK